MGMLIGNKQMMSNGNNVSYPVYESSIETPAKSSLTLSAEYPTGIVENDILFLQTGSSRNELLTVGSPWTLISRNAASAMNYALYWTRATGSESGTVTITGTESFGSKYAVMSRFSGAVEVGTPYTDLSVFGIGYRATTTIDIGYNPIVKSLGLAFFYQEDNSTWTNNSTNYTEVYKYTNSFSTDWTNALQSYNIESGINPGSAIYSVSGSEYSAAVGLLLIGK